MRDYEIHWRHQDTVKAANRIRGAMEQNDLDPNCINSGVILGSGLGGFPNDHMHPDSIRLSYKEVLLGLLPEDTATIKGHAKEFIIGPLKDAPTNQNVIVLAGRYHPYEGIDLSEAIVTLRTLQVLQVQNLLGSNAAGSVTPTTLQPLDLMINHDSIDNTKQNPLAGNHYDAYGPRFPHCADMYTAHTRQQINTIAEELGVVVKNGIYYREMGPNYESRAKVYELRNKTNRIWREAQEQPGEEDYKNKPTAAVGMSSTYEALVAQHASQSTELPAFTKHRAFITAITNYAAGLGPTGPVKPPDHEEVTENGKIIQETFGNLAHAILVNWMKEQ